MLKKVVGFICEFDEPFDNNSIFNNDNLDYSIKFVIDMVYKLEKLGYYVYVFTNINYNWQCTENIEYLPIYVFNTICEYQYFTHIIFNKNINNDFIKQIRKTECSENIYLLAYNLYTFNLNVTLYNLDDHKWLITHLNGHYLLSSDNNDEMPKKICLDLKHYEK